MPVSALGVVGFNISSVRAGPRNLRKALGESADVLGRQAAAMMSAVFDSDPAFVAAITWCNTPVSCFDKWK